MAAMQVDGHDRGLGTVNAQIYDWLLLYRLPAGFGRQKLGGVLMKMTRVRPGPGLR